MFNYENNQFSQSIKGITVENNRFGWGTEGILFTMGERVSFSKAKWNEGAKTLKHAAFTSCLPRPGDKVRITCTDPGTLNDIPTWCRINDHSVLECDQQNHQIIFLVQKSEHGN